MKNDCNVIEILDYVLQISMREKVPSRAAQEEVFDRLRKDGISEENIIQAFMWWIMFHKQPYLNNVQANSNSLRVFDEYELNKIGVAGCDFVIFLEKTGILDAKTREIVLNQLMFLPQPTCQLGEVKWVVLMVLIICVDKADFDAKLDCFVLLMSSSMTSC